MLKLYKEIKRLLKKESEKVKSLAKTRCAANARPKEPRTPPRRKSTTNTLLVRDRTMKNSVNRDLVTSHQSLCRVVYNSRSCIPKCIVNSHTTLQYASIPDSVSAPWCQRWLAQGISPVHSNLSLFAMRGSRV